MKIGLVRRGYSATGGAEKYLLRLAAGLAAAGHKIVLFSDSSWPREAFTSCCDSVTQVAVPSRDPLSFAKTLQRILPLHPCDVVLSLERVFACDLYRAGDGVHAAWLERRRRFDPAWKHWFRWFNRKHARLLRLERALFSGGARRVIANSQMVKREITERYGYPEDRISVVYNGVPAAPTDSAARTEVRAELGFSDDEYVALFVGSGWGRKGLQVASDAVAKVTGTRLWIVGKGKPIGVNSEGSRRWVIEEKGFSGAIHQRGKPSELFLGPREDVPRLMAAVDVFILPTIYDPFSNACLEALAAGLPVITTAANGFSEIIEPGLHGSIVADPADYLATADALRYWQDRTRRESTRETRLARASEFSMERNLAETIRVMGEIQR